MIKYTHRHDKLNHRTRVLCRDLQSDSPVVIAMEMPNDHLGEKKEDLLTYTEEGFVRYFKEIKPWEDCKIDDPVYVRNEARWLPRYFAGIDDHGRPEAWTGGATSFSTDGSCSCWGECIPADQFDQFDKDNPSC